MDLNSRIGYPDFRNLKLSNKVSFRALKLTTASTKDQKPCALIFNYKNFMFNNNINIINNDLP